MPVNAKGDDFSQCLRAQRQHHQRSTPNATPEQSGIPTFKASIDSGQWGAAANRAPRAYGYLVKALLLLTGIRQFMETIRQLIPL